jgi:hypothetical protein
VLAKRKETGERRVSIKTVTIQIGNSDNKLKQAAWSEFCYRVEDQIQYGSEQVHFFGFSLPNAEWQNAAWVFEATDRQIERLRECIADWCEDFEQDSIAMTIGDTEFVTRGG